VTAAYRATVPTPSEGRRECDSDSCQDRWLIGPDIQVRLDQRHSHRDSRRTRPSSSSSATFLTLAFAMRYLRPQVGGTGGPADHGAVRLSVSGKASHCPGGVRCRDKNFERRCRRLLAIPIRECLSADERCDCYRGRDHHAGHSESGGGQARHMVASSASWLLAARRWSVELDPWQLAPDWSGSARLADHLPG
jgi:hypothetical protein